MKSKIKHLELWEKFRKEKNEDKKINIKNEIVEIYYPLVRKISHKVAERIKWRLTPDELSSFGYDGLDRAISRFDPDRGVKFESYANLRISGSMIDGIRKEDQIPRSVRINCSAFEKTREEIEGETGRKAREEEVIERMGLDEDKFIKNRKKYNPATFSSIDEPSFVTDDDSNFKQDMNVQLSDKSLKNIDSSLTQREFFSKLMGKNFSKVEREIIYLYYYENLTMDRIADYMKMSESRISQLHKDIIPRLKEKIFRNPNFFFDDIKKYSIKLD